ncbi:cache domain-containing sensor histidine kinase [Paenibacillus sp. DMB20]|uniref:cache domain-containing sensor histidine kinase n=1 Tax=Paenibacillus sp. DMB20 TaxID=1642570 RepID=UPI000627BC0A|nr:sensor histidine kinase [Paenibacillus sp. DMB20]KKO52107.1 histidine kinase [Paenibacillus sp. DMB20]
MNLRNKLFTAFLGLIIIPLLVLGLFTFFVTYNSIEKKYSQQAEYSLKAISYSILNVFQEMENVTDTGIASSVFTTALKADDPDSQDLADGKQLKLNESQRNFRNLLYNHPAISYAFLYNMNKKSPPVPIFTKEDFGALPYSKFKESHLYQEVIELNGVPKWIAPHEYPELTGMEPVFTQIRLVKNIESLRKEGILVVQIKRLEFERIFRNLTLPNNLQDTSFLLVNDEGLILFDPKDQSDGKNMSAFMDRQIDYGSDYQSFKSKFDGVESVVSIHKLEGYPWSIISVTKWHSLSQEVTAFAKWFIVILGLCLVTAVAFNKFFMNRITGTIGVIVRFMRRVEDGDLSARVEEKGEDELLLLSRGFNDLMDRINRLFDQIRMEQRQKTEAHMRLLQAQIKPHFLFNTLESINVLAVQNEGRKVSEMVYRLASILRISIQEKEEITLEEEIKYLKSYLEIQKFRFEDLFDYEIDVPKELLTCRILKLTLQPLVENSIQHGFEGIDYKGMLRIKAWSERGNLIVHVEDNGHGMSPEQLSLFEYMVPEEKEARRPGEENLKVNHERRGLGLRSVADRIRIQYGDYYGLFICSNQPGGTVIHCVIPNHERE